MTLRRKLLLSQLPLAAALLLLSALFYRATDALGQDSASILQDNFRTVLALQRMKEAADALDVEAARVAEGDASAPGPDFAPLQQQFERELELQEHNITEPGEAAATAQLRSAWDGYRDGLSRLAGNPARARAVYAAQLRPRLRELRDAAARVMQLNVAPILRKNDRVRIRVGAFERVLVLAALAALLAGVIASAALTARLLRPLGILGQTVRRIGEGDLEAHLPAEGRDELASLARDVNAMAERLRRYRQSSLGELLETQQAAQAAIDSLSDPVLVLDAQGRLVNLNRAAEEGLGLEAGGPFPDTLAPPLRQALERVLAQVVESGRGYVPHGFEEAIRQPLPGGDRFLLPRGHPLSAAGRAVTGATVVLQDVTRIRLFDELKNDWVATVAHEFRTPLTSLRMAIHLCLEELAGPLTEKQADLLHAAREDCERLQSMVDDLLNVARLQPGRAGLVERPIAVAELLAPLEEHRKEAEERGVQLGIEPAPEGLAVRADPDRLGLVFANLISNALQHTPRGGAVQVRVRTSRDAVRFEVSDTGRGIPPEYRARIFERFFQVPGVSAGAAGLGLYISREVVRAHGGEIGVESAPGEGSTFWFTLPVRSAAGA